MRISVLVICSGLLLLLIHPAFSTQLTLEAELMEIFLDWELGLKISEEGLAISRAETQGLRKESAGLRADTIELKRDLRSVERQKTDLELSFSDYKGNVQEEAKMLIEEYEQEIRAQKAWTVIWSIVAGVLGVAAGLSLSVIF